MQRFTLILWNVEGVEVDDNTLFVLPKKYADEIALQSEGDLTVWEEALGFKKGYFSNSGGLVKIDVTDVDDLNLRIPDGNEFGANELWQPGGRTYPGYTLEAVTDVIPNELTTVTRLE